MSFEKSLKELIAAQRKMIELQDILAEAKDDVFRRYIEHVDESEGYDFINGMSEDDQIMLNKIKEGK